MNAVKKWILAVRAPFFSACAMPVIFGATLAYYETGNFHWWYFGITLLGLIAAHAGANLANDYFDHKTKDDEINPNFTPFSGGSRMIQNGILSARAILRGAFISYVLALVAGIYLTAVTPGYWVLILAVAGFMGGFFYTAGKFAFAYHGLGELTILVNFGILPVMGSYYVQTGAFSWSAFWTSFPIGFLITAILYINQFPDYDADKAVRKNHLVVALGKEKARAGYYFLIYGSYAAIMLLVLFGYLTPYSLAALLSLPIAVKTTRIFAANYNKIKELIPAQAGTIQVHTLVGLLMSIGCVVGALLKKVR
ncbi:MAG: 1,4-dihydroxy-2-naphthoate octaprenyltransferase [candidate division Zixibacteria bacterium]|nr:1,4-dihydroxy-2-naphthoate octaprenyltransferase [candidate division Zixibacteria bacterium]